MPGTRFELGVHGNTDAYRTDGGPLEPDGNLLLSCERLAASDPGDGRVELVWGETDPDSWPNGVEDGRRLAFEIRQIDGPCPPGGDWRLTVRGN